MGIRQQWDRLGSVGRWATGVASGVATLIAAWFAVSGFMDTMDGWVISEAEAEELQKAQLEILNEYRMSLADERRQREIEHAQMELDSTRRQISYLNNLANRTPDQNLELSELVEYQADLRKRLRTLRCIAAGNPPDECSV